VIRKIVVILAAVLVLQAVATGISAAQDFTTLLSQAAAANQSWVNQIATASSATSLSSLQAENNTALTFGNQTLTLLQQALPLAPDDASRSRVTGLIQHVEAALASGARVTQATTFDTARSALDAERGEAVEALNEFPVTPTTPTPFATAAPTAFPTASPTAVAGVTTALPAAGGMPIGVAVVAGLVALVAGLRIRRAVR
jgi:hypothetical protein